MDGENSIKFSAALEGWDCTFNFKIIIKLDTFLRLFHILIHLALPATLRGGYFYCPHSIHQEEEACRDAELSNLLQFTQLVGVAELD